VEKCQANTASPTEQPIDSIIEYGSALSEVHLYFMSVSPSDNRQMSPFAKATFDLARATFDARNLLTVLFLVPLRLA
jgi:hypothetical protein